MTRKLLIGVVLLVLAAAAAAQPPETVPKPEKLNPSTVISLRGFQITSPNENGWEIGIRNVEQFLIGKRDASRSVYFEARLQQVPEGNSLDHIQALSSLRKEMESLIQTKDTHSPVWSRVTKFKGVTCLSYQDEDVNPADAMFKYTRKLGFICQHPKSDKLIIRMEYGSGTNIKGSSNGSTREELEDRKFSETIVNSLTFTDNT